jgi:hypothetical protein
VENVSTKTRSSLASHLAPKIRHDLVGPGVHQFEALKAAFFPRLVHPDQEVPDSFATPDRLGLWPVPGGNVF